MATPVYVPYRMFRRKEKCPLSGAKTQIQYVNPGTFLLPRYRYILLCFYYVATETGAPRLLSTSLYSVNKLPNKLTVNENP